MLTVGKEVSQVEWRLSEGLLACPDCSGRLGRWGHARARALRGDDGSLWACRPRRARCAGCARTHVLLPVRALLRRADVVEVIGVALGLAAVGWGHRRIAELLSRPAATVRGAVGPPGPQTYVILSRVLRPAESAWCRTRRPPVCCWASTCDTAPALAGRAVRCFCRSHRIIDAMRHERYRFSPARRVHIVRREALCCIPIQLGGTWRIVSGSNG